MMGERKTLLLVEQPARTSKSFGEAFPGLLSNFHSCSMRCLNDLEKVAMEGGPKVTAKLALKIFMLYTALKK